MMKPFLQIHSTKTPPNMGGIISPLSLTKNHEVESPPPMHLNVTQLSSAKETSLVGGYII